MYILEYLNEEISLVHKQPIASDEGSRVKHSQNTHTHTYYFFFFSFNLVVYYFVVVFFCVV